MGKSNAIIFINFKLVELANGKLEVTYLSHDIVMGRLKDFGGTEVKKNGDLLCVQRDKKGNTLYSKLITNPLQKKLEFIDEFNQFQTKILDLDETNFSVRMQLHRRTRFISIQNPFEETVLIEIKISQE